MKVFAIKYSFKNKDGNNMWGMRMNVANGLEELISTTEKNLEEEEDAIKGSFELDMHLSMKMAKLFDEIKRCSKEENIEKETVSEITADLKNFDNLITDKY